MIRDFHRAFVVIQMVSRLNLDGNAKRRRFQVSLRERATLSLRKGAHMRSDNGDVPF